MRMYDIIEKKRDGHSLTTEEIYFFIENYTRGNIPDYQASALLMAIYFQGMTIAESAALTMAMVQSGNVVDLSSIPGIKVDKHSTGGVGDTTTLILAPLVASLGIPVAKMSGRGLGHTGGTLDKLEAIKGFNIEISDAEFIELVKENGIAVIGQSENIAPADKLLYALRDVTATVNSIPLIASSIMSKKIAAGADKIVLDVKTGSGAFMTELQATKKLAETMVQIGREVGKETVALITNMDQPLGYAIGNALEVKEAIMTLQGEGPEDLTELTLAVGAEMVCLANKATTTTEAETLLKQQLASGAALTKFKQFIAAQGGDPAVVDNVDLLPKAPFMHAVKSDKSGYVTKIEAKQIGRAAMLLGAGRAKKGDHIDLSVGVILHKKVGDYVSAGDTLCTLHSNREDVQEIEEIIRRSYSFGLEKKTQPLMIAKIT